MVKLSHIIEAQQFDHETLNELFALADEMGTVLKHGGSTTLRGQSMMRLFYEPSTRTYASFGQAMRGLGGYVDGSEHAGTFSSTVKGETLEDSVRVIGRLGFDVIVLRHKTEGAASDAAKVSSVPIVNAGDGTGQHPTQALLDLYTIKQRFGRIDGLSVALVGDLKHGRTVRSLAYLLGKFPVAHIYFVSGNGMGAHQGILDYLGEHGVPYTLSGNLAEVAPEVDVIYLTRLQKERLSGDPAEIEKAYNTTTLTREVVARMKANAAVLHPLPRNNELPPWFDDDPRAAYFDQAGNGVAVRMALLQMLLA